jgi:hypothetical protein
MTKKVASKKDASYIDVIDAGFESDTVKEYDPATEEGQIGKEHMEEVAPSNNWKDDKRDAIGRAAHRRALARKLRRIARELEATDLEMEDDIEETVEKVEEAKDEKKEMMEDLDDIIEEAKEDDSGASPKDADKEDEDEDYDYEEGEKSAKKGTKKEAIHPIQHDVSRMDPAANMPSDTGDAEWVNIGPAKFEDKRDQVGKAS